MSKLKKGKQKILVWKKGKQKLAVFVEVNKKVHQVDLDEEKMNRLISSLPQLFDDGVIKIVKEEFPIVIGDYNEI